MMEHTENEWKNEAPRLGGVQKPVPNEPDEAYFDSLSETIMQRIKVREEWENEAPVLASVDKPILITPHKGYFDTLHMEISNRITEKAEWENEAVLLAGIDKPVVDLPADDYFDALPAAVMKRIKKENAPVVHLIPTILRYGAIAACMTGMLFLYKGFAMKDNVYTAALMENERIQEINYTNHIVDMYNADELATFLSTETPSAPAEENPAVEELNESVENGLELESLME
jgi:hypothetical protein